MNAVEKAMRVLMAFDGRQRHLSLSQIAALTRLDLSAAQRFTFKLLACLLFRLSVFLLPAKRRTGMSTNDGRNSQS